MKTSRTLLVPAVLLGGLAVTAVVLVAASLRRPEVPEFPPTPSGERPAGDTLVGPVTYTIDASDPGLWRFFSFAQGSVIEHPLPGEWDLAFRRFNIIVNGGEGLAGQGGVLDLGPVGFPEVRRVPADGYEVTEVRRDSVALPLRRWYRYGFASHLLTPKPHVYALRTADGRYAKLEILSYYCPGALPGCVTFRYAFQGEGGTDVERKP